MFPVDLHKISIENQQLLQKQYDEINNPIKPIFRTTINEDGNVTMNNKLDKLFNVLQKLVKVKDIPKAFNLTQEAMRKNTICISGRHLF